MPLADVRSDARCIAGAFVPDGWICAGAGVGSAGFCGAAQLATLVKPKVLAIIKAINFFIKIPFLLND